MGEFIEYNGIGSASPYKYTRREFLVLVEKNKHRFNGTLPYDVTIENFEKIYQWCTEEESEE
jgi:hypothetical protein